MFPLPFLCRVVCWLVLAVGWLGSASNASAQQQDRPLFDRIMRPNMDLHAEGFGKAYEPGSNGDNKSFLTRLFNGSHSATPRGGDGWFHSSSFNSGKGGYASTGFVTKKSSLSEQSASRYTKQFDSKSVAVKEDRAAGKTASVKGFEPSGKVFDPQGKRQDSIDELRRQKNLTIDQVRELLNKNK